MACGIRLIRFPSNVDAVADNYNYHSSKSAWHPGNNDCGCGSLRLSRIAVSSIALSPHCGYYHDDRDAYRRLIFNETRGSLWTCCSPALHRLSIAKEDVKFLMIACLYSSSLLSSEQVGKLLRCSYSRHVRFVDIGSSPDSPDFWYSPDSQLGSGCTSIYRVTSPVAGQFLLSIALIRSLSSQVAVHCCRPVILRAFTPDAVKNKTQNSPFTSRLIPLLFSCQFPFQKLRIS